MIHYLARSPYLQEMPQTLLVNEIYLSLQGESTFAGLPCIFIRLNACNLRCSYCDTAYAFTQGTKQTLAGIHAKVMELADRFRGTNHARKSTSENEVLARCPSEGPRDTAGRLPLVELTGGEPLLQQNVIPLMKSLCDDGFTVLLETSGAHDIAQVDERVRRIVDIKCPSSGESGRNRWENLPHLKNSDEVKFVIGTREDYAWAKQIIVEHQLDAICPLLFSWVHPLAPEQQDKSLQRVPAGQTPISRQELAEKIIEDALPVRFQIQLHKIIWAPEKRGV
jgi:7-carboxy-7-deazaguanine synthase